MKPVRSMGHVKKFSFFYSSFVFTLFLWGFYLIANRVEIGHLIDTFKQQNQFSVSRLTTQVEKQIGSETRSFQLFLSSNNKDIEKLSADVFNSSLKQLVQMNLYQFYPDMQGFALINQKGNILLKEGHRLIDPEVEDSIRKIAAKPRAGKMVIACLCENYVGMVGEWQGSQHKGLFFVALDKTPYLSLIEKNEQQDQVLFLMDTHFKEDRNILSLKGDISADLKLRLQKGHYPEDSVSSNLEAFSWQVVGFQQPAIIARKLESKRYEVINIIISIGILGFSALILVFRQINLRIKEEVGLRSRYQNLFVDSGVVSIIVNAQNGQIVEVNHAACEFYGYSQKQLSSLNMDDLNVDSSVRFRKCIQDAIDLNKKSMLCQHRLKNRRIVLLEAHFTPFSQDKQQYYFIIFHDETEQNKTQKEVQRKSALLESIMAGMPDIILILDENGNYIDVQGRQREGDFDLRSLLGLNVFDLYPNEISKAGLNTIKKALATNKTITLEYPLSLKDQKGWYEGRVVAIKDNSYGIPCVLWLARNIDQRKQQEHELNIAARVMQLSDPIAICDPQFQIVQVNKAFDAMFSEKAGQSSGKSIFSTFSPMRDQSEVKQQIISALESQQEWNGLAYQMRQDGKEVPTYQNIDAIADQDGNTVNYVVIFRDFSELNDMKEMVKASESRFRVMVESSHDLIMVMNKKEITYVSPSLKRILGYSEKELIQKTFKQILHPDDQLRVVKSFLKCKQKLGSHAELAAFRALSKDQNWIWIEGSMTNLKNEPGIEGVVINLENVSERIEFENRLKIEELRFRSIIERSSDVIVLFGRDQRISYASPSTYRVLGYDKEQILGKRTIDLVHPDDVEKLKQSFGFLVQNPGKSNHFKDLRVIDSAGNTLEIEGTSTSLFDVEGIESVLFIARDVTEKLAIERQLHKHAYFDSLTDLPNRTYLMDFLEKAVSNAARHQHLGVIVFIDLDHFKNVNDSLGHSIGDLLLKSVAKRLQGELRKEDMLARLGGDEFVVVLQEVAENEDAVIVKSEQFCDQLLHSMSEKFMVGDHELYITPSIGLKIFPTHEESVDQLLRHADGAMYRAKSLGRNQYVYYDSEIQKKADERLRLEKGLREAIEKQQLEVHYQPQFTVDGDLIGAEALVRWRHPELGLRLPQEFMSIAEDSGLINKIDLWVFAQVARDFTVWKENKKIHESFKVSVNVSSRQFLAQDFVSDVSSVFGLFPMIDNHIKFEITETLLMDNLDAASTVMEELKKHHISFALDDFGTGYSSLQYLAKLPIDELKIDRSFISNLSNNSDEAVIVEMILTMAHYIDLDVIAEGVETKSQLEFLALRGKPFIQGFFFSRPLNCEEFVAFLSKTSNPS